MLRSRQKERIIEETLARVPALTVGPAGPPGPAGAPGAAGAAGATGPQGSSGIGVPGFDGKTGKDSFIPGPSGGNGPPGVAGVAGPKGDFMLAIDGRTREPLMIPGRDGSQGPQGWMGPPGLDGKSGPMGFPIPGERGFPGTNGAAGRDGVLIPPMDWGRIALREPMMIEGRPGRAGRDLDTPVDFGWGRAQREDRFPFMCAPTSTNPIVCKLAADLSNSTVTAAKVTGLDRQLDPGTYVFEYWIIYQAAAVTTGVKFSVNHTGTLTSFVCNMLHVNSAATVTNAPSQAENLATAAPYEGHSARAKSAAAGMGPTLSVDVANADMLIKVEGVMVVTARGNIELWYASEVAAATTVKAGTALIITRIA